MIDLKPYGYFSFILNERGLSMSRGKASISVLLSFLIMMFLMVIGCGKMEATSAISGTVTVTVNGENISNAGVTLTLSGDANRTTTIDANGKYSFTNQDNGYFTVTPSYLPGYTFSPASTKVYVNGTSVSGIDFTGTFTGYSISGKVTGTVQEGVTLTATKATTVTNTATTASDGNYTLSGIMTNGSYTVTPSLKGYKFTPYNKKEVTVASDNVTSIDFVSARAHANGTAAGTYTWDSTTGVLTITWTSADFPCNWPKTGTPETESIVTITTTSMTWPGSMTWTRTPSGTAGDPIGTWTATDESGNTYTATITTSSISLTGNMVACTDAWTEHLPSHYYVWLSYQDPDRAAASVIVTGPGTSGLPLLTYSTSDKAWKSGSPAEDIGVTTPSLPYLYTFTITDTGTAGTTWVETATISCFVALPTDLGPTETVTTATPTFDWSPVGDGAVYQIELHDSGDALIWTSDKTLSTSINYSGDPALISGNTYHYTVNVKGTSACPRGQSTSDPVDFKAF
jgi:hypothetical protein